MASSFRLPSVPASGLASTTGKLMFGIGTQANNGLGNATVITSVDGYGNIWTTYPVGGKKYTGFLDSGTNTYTFLNSATSGLKLCTSPAIASFYCPSTPTSLTATISGKNNASTQVTFTVADPTRVSANISVLSTLGTEMPGFPSSGTSSVPDFLVGPPLLLRPHRLHGDRESRDAWRPGALLRVLEFLASLSKLSARRGVAMRTENLSKDLLLVAIFAACTWGCGGSTSAPPGTGGNPGTGGSNGAGGSRSTGGSVGTGGASATGGSLGTGGRSGSGSGGASTAGQPGSGGAVAGGTTTGTGGSGPAASGGIGALGGAGTGGSSASGGTTSQRGTGGTSASGGNSGQGGGSAAGGAGGGAAVDGGGSSTAVPSAGCGKTPTLTSSQYNKGTTIPITAAGLQRRYVLNIPTNYDNSHPYTLVVTIHARDGNDIQMYNWQYYGLLPQSNNTAIFAAPNGQMNGAPCSGTGVGESGCGWPNPNGQDMALMDAVVAQVEENFCVDTHHIYATGWSYGASMSYEVGCERPLGGTGSATWGVRAIAIYSGAQMSGSCKPSTSNPVAYYESHGTCDSVLSYDGTSRCSTQTGEAGGVGLAKNWATADGCTWQIPTKVTSGTHVCTKMAGCKSGYPVEFCSFNGDHTPFPDTGQSQGSWGPPEVWKFFSQF